MATIRMGSSIARGFAAALTALAGLVLVAPAAQADGPVCLVKDTHKLTYAQRGGSITLLPGQCLRLALRTASDGGYSWRTEQRAARSVVRVLAVTEVPDKHPPGVVGGYSTTYYIYRPVGTGSTTLRLAERQGGQTQQGDHVFTLTIRVR